MSRTFTGYDWTILADHVAPFPVEVGYVSTFNAAILEARIVTGRNVDTGQVRPGKSQTLLAGTVIYLILLEQIGKSLRPHGNRRVKGEKELEKAIRQFTPTATTKKQRQVMYALRCALAHELGFFNRSAQSSYRRAFRLDDAPGGPLVQWSTRPWNGAYVNVDGRSLTTVNIVTVGDLAEGVIRSIRTHSNRTTLRSEHPGAELKMRFGFSLEE